MIQEDPNKVDEDFIVIAEDSTNTDLITDLSTIDCFYHIYGTTLKMEKIPYPRSYEGETPEDYTSLQPIGSNQNLYFSMSVKDGLIILANTGEMHY